MPETNSRLLVQKDGEVTIIEFMDRQILEETNIQQIGDDILRMVDNSAVPKFLISFENVDHLSSAALGQLITINNRIRQRDGQLKLSNIDPQIYEVFTITHLNKVFQIYDTSQQALATFK